MKLRTRSDFGEYLKECGMLGPAAEVGVAEGRYSLEMLQWGVPMLYLIDLWEHVPDGDPHGDLTIPQGNHDSRYRDCMEKIEPYKGRTTVLRGWSAEMADHIPDESLTYLHIDATHTAAGVQADLSSYWPKLMTGGIVSGHDYLSPVYTVREGVDTWAASRDLEVHALDIDRPLDACFWIEKL